jgi:hypothetical protein
MSSLLELEQHLLALKKAGQTKATIDIEWLLSVLKAPKVTVPTPQTAKPVNNNSYLDGGGFYDDL